MISSQVAYTQQLSNINLIIGYCKMRFNLESRMVIKSYLHNLTTMFGRLVFTQLLALLVYWGGAGGVMFCPFDHFSVN